MRQMGNIGASVAKENGQLWLVFLGSGLQWDVRETALLQIFECGLMNDWNDRGAGRHRHYNRE